MNNSIRASLAGGAAWLVFPLVPVLLAGGHYETANPPTSAYGAPDPYDWSWITWMAVVGPLLGYGLLAGATLDLPDDHDARGWRRWLSRRALWVSVVPWTGWVVWCILVEVVPRLADNPLASWWNGLNDPGKQLALEAYLVGAGALLGGAWLVPAVFVLRRARRRGQLRKALGRGAAWMVAFVGSLFGTFWAITKACSGYFFDGTLIPIGLALLTVTALSGCAGTITYGEVRRRELFQALLVSWVFGLAILWRWWGRPRRK